MSFHPQTPQSPSQLSPGTSDPSTSMTSSMTTVTTLPTPAHSVNGSTIPFDVSNEVVMGDRSNSPQKRKRPIEDDGDREQKKAHVEDRRLGIENLHLDVGQKYLLCRTQHTPCRPNIADDLFARFGLTGIADDVARVLPNGEKNSLRKTYKGHIKKLGVNGRFDSVNQDPNRPEGFLAMLHHPQDSWDIHQVQGKEVQDGLRLDPRALQRATTMAPGALPKHVWDSSVLGEMAPGALVKVEKQTTSARPTAPNTPLLHASGPAQTKPLMASAPELARPKRNGKKRGYGDNSFDGYGEGFPDDDQGGETGYSTGEGDFSGQKRRKKSHPGGHPYTQGRQQAFGSSMVGA